MLQNINISVKEGIINAFQISSGCNIRPFDLILMKSSNIKYNDIFTKLLDIDEYNICGMIINKHVINPDITDGMIYDNLNYVLFNIDDKLIIDRYDIFIEKYGICNIQIKNIKNNILDNFHIDDIQKKMDKLYLKHNNKYNIIGIIYSAFNIIIDCPEVFENKCITFDKFSLQHKFK